MQDIINLLSHPVRVYSREEVLKKPSPVPHEPGAYAWFFREIPTGVPIDECNTWNGLTMLYVGISPSPPSKTGKSSKRNLFDRIHTHFNGNAYGSTLRRTLGCLLREQLEIHPAKTGTGSKFTFGEGEQRLSAWMAENAFVTWQVHETPWIVETVLIHAINLPLNLEKNTDHPFYPILSAIRSKCKQAAL